MSWLTFDCLTYYNNFFHVNFVLLQDQGLPEEVFVN